MGQAPRRRLPLWTAVGSSWPPCHTGTHQSQRGPADSILRFSLVLTMAVPRKRLGDPKDARTAFRELPVQHRGELPAVLSGVVFRLTVLDAVFDADASRPVTARLLAGGRAPAAGTLQHGVGAPLRDCSLQVAGRCVQPLFGFTKTAVMQGPCPHVRRSASASRRNSWKRNPHFAGHCETAVRAACGRGGGSSAPHLHLHAGPAPVCRAAGSQRGVRSLYVRLPRLFTCLRAVCFPVSANCLYLLPVFPLGCSSTLDLLTLCNAGCEYFSPGRRLRLTAEYKLSPCGSLLLADPAVRYGAAVLLREARPVPRLPPRPPPATSVPASCPTQVLG